MTTVADRDSGGQTRDHIVDLALWWLHGRDNPPPAIAQLSAEQRGVRWAQLAEVAARQGDGFIRALAEDVAARKRTHPTTDVDGTAEPGH